MEINVLTVHMVMQNENQCSGDNRPPKCMLRGAKPSNFVPYACDWAVTGGEYEGPELPHRRPLFPVVACIWQRNGRTVLRGLSHLYFPSLGLPKCWGPMLALCPFFL